MKEYRTYSDGTRLVRDKSTKKCYLQRFCYKGFGEVIELKRQVSFSEFITMLFS